MRLSETVSRLASFHRTTITNPCSVLPREINRDWGRSRRRIFAPHLSKSKKPSPFSSFRIGPVGCQVLIGKPGAKCPAE